MKLNCALNICYIFCLALALSIQPINIEATSEVSPKKESVKLEKAKVAPQQQDADFIHGDLLFR